MVFPAISTAEIGFDKPKVIDNLYGHVHFLSVTVGDRYLWKEESLERTAEYIEGELAFQGYPVRRQSFRCYDREAGNLIAEAFRVSNSLGVMVFLIGR